MEFDDVTSSRLRLVRSPEIQSDVYVEGSGRWMVRIEANSLVPDDTVILAPPSFRVLEFFCYPLCSPHHRSQSTLQHGKYRSIELFCKD